MTSRTNLKKLKIIFKNLKNEMLSSNVYLLVFHEGVKVANTLPKKLFFGNASLLHSPHETPTKAFDCLGFITESCNDSSIKSYQNYRKHRVQVCASKINVNNHNMYCHIFPLVTTKVEMFSSVRLFYFFLSLWWNGGCFRGG